MALKDFITRLFPPAGSSGGKASALPRLGESRPSGHFREFTVPRRYQRGGSSKVTKAPDSWARCNGIVPCTGENIP
jgi:hypothetical protein